MRRTLYALALALASLPALYGQQTSTTPDCSPVPLSFTGTGTGASYDNTVSTRPCRFWAVTFKTTGFSSVTVAVQISSDNASFTTILNTACSSTNPPASPCVIDGASPVTPGTQGTAGYLAYGAYVRLNITSVSGSGTGTATLFGYKGQLNDAPSTSSVTITPSGTQDVNLIKVAGTPVLTGGVAGSQGVGGLNAVGVAPTGNPFPTAELDSSGALITPDYCTLKAIVSDTTLITGATKVISASGGTTIRVCKVSFTTDTITTFQLKTGTKTTNECDTTTAVQTGVYSGAGGGLFGVIEDYGSALVTAAGKDLCVFLSAGVTTHGGITILYSQR